MTQKIWESGYSYLDAFAALLSNLLNAVSGSSSKLEDDRDDDFERPGQTGSQSTTQQQLKKTTTKNMRVIAVDTLQRIWKKLITNHCARQP